MAEAKKTRLRLEIAYVLFIDIVGYSKLRINDQSEQIQKLREIVRGTDQFRSTEAEGKLLRLPTGDGGALDFRNNPEAPVLCALEIAEALKDIRFVSGWHSQGLLTRSPIKRTGQHRRGRNQHCAANNGLWRRRANFGFQTRRRRSRAV
jgi:hypothetical protein